MAHSIFRLFLLSTIFIQSCRLFDAYVDSAALGTGSSASAADPPPQRSAEEMFILLDFRASYESQSDPRSLIADGFADMENTAWHNPGAVLA
jgi:hypothetical protein